MAVGICLPHDALEKFKINLKSGKINPDELANMTSEERHKLFASIVGEGDARTTNSLFESKLLLKNKLEGYKTWARTVAGIKPEVRRDLISRISRMDERILNPEEEKAFLKDLAATKLGFGVTSDETRVITKMSMKVQELAAKARSDGTFANKEDRLAYGRAKVDMGNYLAELKNKSEKLSFGQHFLHPAQSLSKVAGFQKSIQAAFDDSALFRQNFKTLLSHPGIWTKNALKNIADLKRAGINNQDIMREATADVISRPYAEKYYKNMGIAPKVEEEFGDPAFVTKVPLVGRIYKTTEMAFNAVMLRTRADLADYYIDLAKTINGEAVPKGSPLRNLSIKIDSKLKVVKAVNIEDKTQQQALGRMIGGLTGRGDLGRLEGTAASSFNNIFFSPRFVKSQIDTVLHPITGAGGLSGKGSNYVRQEAAKNLVKIVGGTAAIFATANAIRPGSVELDPRSPNFGKIKVGDTTFDVTGGFGPIAILASRLVTQQYKSGSRGTVSSLGSNPAVPTGSDLVMKFVQGKLSPAAQRAWVNLVTHKENNGSKPTVGGQLYNGLMPLPVQTVVEAKQDPHAANAIVTEVADALGISANTNNPAQQVKPLSKADQGLKTKVGTQQFQQYQKDYNNKLTTFLNSDYYKNLPNDKKQKAVSHKQTTIKHTLYKHYGYKAPKTNPQANKTLYHAVDAAGN